MENEEVIKKLPYTAPFLFVDEILEIDRDGVKGEYTLKLDEYFYKGHFINHPVTPGVILTEIMAQIGLACLGIYLFKDTIEKDTPAIAMSSTAIDFYKPVFPGEKVTVISKKEYFRFHKLKCTVSMYATDNKLIAKGTIAGMIAKNEIT